MRYLGPKANKTLAYSVCSVSGTILAVCSCTVLPLFAGIWRMGAGLGPATAFLYSGPAINVLAIVLTARVLGLKLGVARAVGAVVFSVVIGLLAIVVGSGIMGERLAQGNPAIAPLANSIATGAGLYVLIVIFGPISCGHFNPVVTMVTTWFR
jgi:uncharacterized membrane protein YraQ (UPF0718 family)